MKYGEDFVSFGYKAGGEGVVKVIVTNIRELIPTDQFGTGLNSIPMTKDIQNIQQMDLIINISAGDPGTKQWVQFASTPYDILTVSGCTGVQAPLLYPYIPNQLRGLLGAIKGLPSTSRPSMRPIRRLRQCRQLRKPSSAWVHNSWPTCSW